MKKYITIIILLFPILVKGQESFKGMIMEKTNPKDNLGVAGVSVHWLDTTVGTTTNEKGWFTIPYKEEYKKLVVSYIGYKTDTLTITNLKPIHNF